MRAFFGDGLLGNLHQDFLAFLQQIRDGRQLALNVVTGASAHASAEPACPAFWNPLGALLISGSAGGSPQFSAPLFRVFGFGCFTVLFMLACFHLFGLCLQAFDCRTVAVFVLFVLFLASKSFSFVLACGMFVHVGIAHSLSKFPAQRDHLIIQGRKLLLFQFVIIGEVKMLIIQVGHLSLFFLNLLFFNYAAG